METEESAGENLREKLSRLGARALTDPELLSMLLGKCSSGRATESVAEDLLARHGGFRGLIQQDPRVLSRRWELHPARLASVLAALEIGRRGQKSQDLRPRLRTPAEIHRYLAPELWGLRREVFHVLSLNPRHVLLDDSVVAEGTTNACPVDLREVFGTALAARAAAIVVAHNHPSGDAEPSSQDLALTAQLVEAGALLGIHVLDHLVVGHSTFVSLAQRGYVARAAQREATPCAAGRS